MDKESVIKWTIIVICISLLAMDFNFYSTFRWLRVEHYSDSIRISGPFSFLGPNEMGIFFTMYTFLLIGITYFVENRKWRYLILFVCTCNFYPILYSYSRSAYMCTLAGILTIGILKDRRFILLLVILIFAYSFILPKSVVERIDMTFLDREATSEEKIQSSAFDIGDTTIEITGRKQLWEKALSYFQKEPLIGIGFDTFRHKEGWITHSQYMKILAEQGIVGAIIFIIFLLTLMTQSFKLFKYSKNKLGQGIGLGFFTATIIHMVGSISGDQSLYYNFMAVFWFFIGIVARFNTDLAGITNQGLRSQG
jgi:O-antigen ligase